MKKQYFQTTFPPHFACSLSLLSFSSMLFLLYFYSFINILFLGTLVPTTYSTF